AHDLRIGRDPVVALRRQLGPDAAQSINRHAFLPRSCWFILPRTMPRGGRGDETAWRTQRKVAPGPAISEAWPRSEGWERYGMRLFLDILIFILLVPVLFVLAY